MKLSSRDNRIFRPINKSDGLQHDLHSDYTYHRFWDKVDLRANIELCWVWMGSKTSQGYGHFKFNGKTEKAQRVSYHISSKTKLGNLQVLHKCDNPSCCNPNHLFLGTNADNVKDKMKKGRHRYAIGSNSYLSKIKEADVLEIRRLYKEEHKGSTEISKLYSIKVAAVSHIIHNRTWKHLKDKKCL